jgi:hypothetical protein
MKKIMRSGSLFLASFLTLSGALWFAGQAFAQSGVQTLPDRQNQESQQQRQGQAKESEPESQENAATRRQKAEKRRQDAEKRQRDAERRLRELNQ